VKYVLKSILFFASTAALITSFDIMAFNQKVVDISDLISKEEFSTYKHVGEFIEHSPKVTLVVPADKDDIAEYGKGVMKSLTGSDCDRDGKMDDNATCNAVYYKLWLKYKR